MLQRHPGLDAAPSASAPRRDPVEDLRRLTTFNRALKSGLPLSSKHDVAVLALLTLAPTWPPALRVKYTDALAQPAILVRLPNVPAPAQALPLGVEIDRQSDGGLRVGRHLMPRDLRPSIAPSEWAPFDALLTGIRLIQYDESVTALWALLASSGVSPTSIERSTDDQGRPSGPYLLVMRALQTNVQSRLDQMIATAAQRI